MRGWLLRIAHNVCIDHARRLGRAPSFVGLEGAGHLGAECSAEDVFVGCRLEMGEVWLHISAEHRAVLHLRHVQGLTHSEIGAVLGRSRSQIKSLLHRALSSLRLAWTEAQASAVAAA